MLMNEVIQWSEEDLRKAFEHYTVGREHTEFSREVLESVFLLGVKYANDNCGFKNHSLQKAIKERATVIAGVLFD